MITICELIKRLMCKSKPKLEVPILFEFRLECNSVVTSECKGSTVLCLDGTESCNDIEQHLIKLISARITVKILAIELGDTYDSPN